MVATHRDADDVQWRVNNTLESMLSDVKQLGDRHCSAIHEEISQLGQLDDDVNVQVKLEHLEFLLRWKNAPKLEFHLINLNTGEVD